MDVQKVVDLAKQAVEKYNDGSPIPKRGEKGYELFVIMCALEYVLSKED